MFMCDVWCPHQECCAVITGNVQSNIFHHCNLSCATGSLNNYDIVCDFPSVVKKTITIDQHTISSTFTAITPGKKKVIITMLQSEKLFRPF